MFQRRHSNQHALTTHKSCYGTIRAWLVNNLHYTTEMGGKEMKHRDNKNYGKGREEKLAVENEVKKLK